MVWDSGTNGDGVKCVVSDTTLIQRADPQREGENVNFAQTKVTTENKTGLFGFVLCTSAAVYQTGRTRQR